MELYINGVEIEDTFAEAFQMSAARILITARNKKWALEAAIQMTGFATSVIGCKCEAGIEGELETTPDGRPGVSVLLMARSKEETAQRLVERVGQCVMTCPTTACYNGLDTPDQVSVGGQLRYFGDGFQMSKLVNGRHFWRIPVMEGEFLVEDKFGVQPAVAGGNILILAENPDAALQAAEDAVEAIGKVHGAVLPFPGGIARSGSKVGSKYKFLNASTNEAFCPTLRGVVETALPEGVNSVLEIVILGLDLERVEEATRVGVLAACIPGVRRISSGNYGGKLGKFKVYLHQVLKKGGAA